MPKMKSILPEKGDLAFRTEMLALLDKHAGNLDSAVMLAIASYTVGQILALQDQRTMTPEMGMAIIQSNIESGNRYIIEAIFKGTDDDKRN